MRLPGSRALLALMLVNVFLQCYDGFATYVGLQAGAIDEGNPLLCTACARLGPAAALGLTKLLGILLLLVIYRLRRSWLAAPALGFIGAYYTVISLAPLAASFAP
jgi:hypothetical protein